MEIKEVLWRIENHVEHHKMKEPHSQYFPIYEAWQIAIDILKAEERRIEARKPKYQPMCKYGYDDCVYDRNYIKYYHLEWYKDLGCPTECQCKDGDHYDDEDK